MSQFLVVFAQPDLLSSVKYGIWTQTLRLLLKDKTEKRGRSAKVSLPFQNTK